MLHVLLQLHLQTYSYVCSCRRRNPFWLLRRYTRVKRILGSLATEYGVRPDSHTFTAACVALQRSGLWGSDAVQEAQRLEALIIDSGVAQGCETLQSRDWRLL